MRHILAEAGTFLDGGGVCGNIVHYAFIIAFVGSAFLVFLYLWRKGKLDMDEEPKIRMMQDDAEDNVKKSRKPPEDRNERK